MMYKNGLWFSQEKEPKKALSWKSLAAMERQEEMNKRNKNMRMQA